MKRDVFIQTRFAMTKALQEAGVDPLVTGAVLTHFELLAAYVLRNDTRIARLEKMITRQETRQKGKRRQKPTTNNILSFPVVKA